MLKNYMQRASKWHTHSPYLQLETLRVQNSYSENNKNPNKKPAHERHLG